MRFLTSDDEYEVIHARAVSVGDDEHLIDEDDEDDEISHQ